MKFFVGMVWLWTCFAPSLFATGIVVRMGPASLGNGGPNPVGVPPSGADLDASYITDGMWEFQVGLPVMGVGKRFQKNKGPYFGCGGAVVIDANAVGPGVYSAFGYDFGWESLRFSAEYKQALGLSQVGLLSPYALRLGVGIWF